MAKPTLMIIDIDGVLCDPRIRMKRIDYKSEKRHDYNKFIKSLREYNKDTYGDKPIRKGIQLYHALKSIFNPDRCVFLTARDEDNFHPTIEWLRKHVDDKIQEADLIMEPLPVLVGDEYNPVYKNSVEYKRIQGLHEKKRASDSDLETAKSNYYQSLGQFQSQKSAILQSEESLKEQQEQLAKTTIYSPIDGTISALNVELSERVLGSSFSQGTNLMTVANLNLMEATVDVDENDVVLISIGDTAKVKIDAFGDREFIGTVTQIGNSAKSSGLGTQDEIVNFEIKIILNTEGENIRPGMSCDAEIETETKYNVWSVPIQSVTARTQQGKIINTNGSVSEDDDNKEKVTKKQSKPDEVVFSIIDNKAKLVKVKTGISDDTYIEIKEGLDGNEEIVNGPYRAISKELEDNLKVMVQKKGKDNTSKK